MSFGRPPRQARFFGLNLFAFVDSTGHGQLSIDVGRRSLTFDEIPVDESQGMQSGFDVCVGH
ncbi:MAG: hypothetical protein ABI606_11225, partial [Rhodoferax sp.]